MRAKDIIALASDGVIDNVSELRDSLSNYSNRPAQQVAEILATQAWRNSHDSQTERFSLEAKRHGKEHRGGKPGDITVIVAIIQLINP